MVETFDSPAAGAVGVVDWCLTHQDEPSCYVEVAKDGTVYVMGRDDLGTDLPKETVECGGYVPSEVPSIVDVAANINSHLR